MRHPATTEQKKAISEQTLKQMVFSAVLAAMVTVMTAYICHVPVGTNGGYVHFGDALIYLAAAILPMPYAMAVGAIGGGLADLLTAPMWAPATIIIKMLIVLPFSNRGTKLLTRRNVIALVIALVITALGYYVAEGILFGFGVAFWSSVSGSVVQGVGSAVIFLVFGAALDRLHFKAKLWGN